MANQNKPLLHDTPAFPLQEGKVNLTSGASLRGSIIFCASAGDFALTFDGASSPVTISMDDGWVFTIPTGATINLTGTAGTFHLSA